jgi:hypothetical protein
MNVDVTYALGALVCGFAAGLDSVITYIGLTEYGFVEANPIYKALPAKVTNFIQKSAFGVFLYGGMKVIGTGFLARVLADHGFYTNAGSLIFWIPAAAFIGLNIRNLLLIRKAKAAKK